MELTLILVYFLLAWAIFHSEQASWKKRRSIDFISIFRVFFLLHLVLPPIGIYLLEKHVIDVNVVTAIVLSSAGSLDRIHVLILTILSYFGVLLGFKLISPGRPRMNHPQHGCGALRVYWFFSIALLLFSVYMFSKALGGELSSIVLASQYRSGALTVTDTGTGIFYKMIGISLPVALIGSACLAETTRWRFVYPLIEVIVILVAAIATGSRRVILVWLLIKIFLSVFHGRMLGKAWLVFILFFSTLVLAYGESLFVLLASDRDVGFDLFVEDEGSLARVLSVVCVETGLSFIESLGVISLYDGGMRFGIDSVRYVLSLIPVSFFAVPDAERFVRYTTVMLTGEQLQSDVPPGFIGYMWVNFGTVGVFFQSIFYGVMGGVIGKMISSRIDGRFGVFVYFYFAYIWALLINSGNWEYWFGDYLLANVWVVGACALYLFRHRYFGQASNREKLNASA